MYVCMCITNCLYCGQIETLQATIVHLQSENTKANEIIAESRIVHELHSKKLVDEVRLAYVHIFLCV